MDVAATPVAVAGQPAPKRRLNLLQLLWFVAGAALLIAGGLYTLRYLSATTFDQQRAFRALDETAGQLDNLNGALAGLLKLMKNELFTTCVPPSKGPECDSWQSSYKARLAIEGVEPGVVTVDRRVLTRACSEGLETLFVLRTKQPEVPSVAVRCKETARSAPPPADPVKADVPQNIQMYGLKGSLNDIIDGFVSQSFFDEVLIALHDGTVITSVPLREPFANDVRHSLHPARITKLNITDASALLPDGAAASNGQAKPAAFATLSGQPVVFSRTIAGDRYEVFVRPMRPKHSIYVDNETAEVAAQQEVLYLVGLRHADLRGDIAGSIGPGSRFWLTLCFLLALFAWPLASVRSKSAADAISWSDLVACLFSLIFIPAALAIGAVWCWEYLALERWADRGAATYAQSIEDYLHAELGQDLKLLAQYRERRLKESTRTGCGWADSPGLPISPTVNASTLQFDSDSQTCRMLGSDRTSNWSPLSTVFATTKEGRKDGGLTAFGPPIGQPDASYAARQYFQTLRLNQGWVAPELNGTQPFVAQRVFSLGDGSRVLQLAIRRRCADGKDETFCGIISGGSRVHGLSAAVLPPLLKFAVIDRNSGSVLFHADDRRSLAENLFVETEQNQSLRAATSVNRSSYFVGRYMGESHRFVYLPVRDLPWGIVVMYSLRDLGDLPWHAGLTALVAYAGFVLLVAAILTFVFIVRARRPIGAARVLWPQQQPNPVPKSALGRLWQGACFYERCGVLFFGAIVAIVTAYESAVPNKISALTWVMMALWILAVAVLVWQRHQLQKAQSAGEAKEHVELHVPCLTVALILMSVLPVVWMSLAYQDAQIQGLIRDGLLSASRDVVRRHDIIGKDLGRWRANTEAGDRFPESWERTVPSATTSLPGFAAGACDKPAATSDVWALCVFEPPPLNRAISTVALDFWRRETWRAAAPTQKQLRRIDLLIEAEAGKDASCYASEGPPTQDGSPRKPSASSWAGCQFRSEDGHAFTIVAGSSPRATSQAIAPDDERFNSTKRAFFAVLPALLVVVLCAKCASFARRRLFVCELHRTAPGRERRPAERIVYYTKAAAENLDQHLQCGAGQRINLAYDPRLQRPHSVKPQQSAYVLDDLDLAAGDASRSSHVLSWLEKLVKEGAALVITSRRSPLERMDNPSAFSAGAENAMTPPSETLRWHELLDSLSLETREVPAASQAKPADLCNRERWRLYTRDERLLLHQIASGAIANPLNRELIVTLANRGDIKLQPWPTIDDEAFKAFVKRAGTEPEMTELLHRSAEGGKSTRRTVMGLLLVIVLLLVVWFSWAAGDQFKIVSAILAGSLAFLGQISQAFSFVRGGSQGGK